MIEPPPRTTDASTQVLELELEPPGLDQFSPRLRHLRPPPPLSRHLAGLAQLPSSGSQRRGGDAAGGWQLARTGSGFVAAGTRQHMLARAISEGPQLQREVVFVQQASVPTTPASRRRERPGNPLASRCEVAVQTSR